MIKGLSEVICKYILREFPARVEIPLTESVTDEMKALYNSANRSLRIKFAYEKRREGLTVSDIALLLHSSPKTIPKYMTLCQLVYKKLEDIGTITVKQYQEVLKKYPLLSELYALIKEFCNVIFSKNPAKSDKWIDAAQKYDIPKLQTFINGIKKDLKYFNSAVIFQPLFFSSYGLQTAKE